MSDLSSNADRLLDLAGAICDERASHDDIVELDSIVVADEASRRCYWGYCWMHVALTMDARVHRALQKVRERDDFNSTTLSPWEADTLMAMAPPDAPASSCSAFPFLSAAFHGSVGHFASSWPVAYLVATVILGIGILIGALVHVSSPVNIATPLPRGKGNTLTSGRQMTFVGRITGMTDCQWADPHTEAFNGANVPLGRKYALSSGLMEITYDTGAKVILEGPVTYEVESAAGGYLSGGKLTARVEKKAESGKRKADSPLSTLDSPLFAVRTPTATVTDLGTEFGVEVDKQGVTTSHVFRGSVQVQMHGPDGTPQGAAQVLHENESARVEIDSSGQSGGNRVTVFDTPAKPASFVRSLVPTIKTLDLVDVVAGGNGFSGRRSGGINPSTGRATGTPPTPREIGFNGDYGYHRVEGLSFVDGVFIPDGRKGAVQVDSVGHVFDRFPQTNNATACYIWAGGDIPMDRPPAHLTELGETDYAASGHGVLFLHANKGITFDLDAIRRANPGSKLLRFLATAGNTETFSATGSPVAADAWVLVDGRERFHRGSINRVDGALTVYVSLRENDRFLTLAATDGGNDIVADWIIFGDPRLELKETSVMATKPEAATGKP